VPAIDMIGETDNLLHIGPHKTGSTAIQVALFSARDRLAELGVYYPGQKRRRREASEELFAAIKRGDADAPTPFWDALVAEIAAAGEQRVCVSDELFGKGSLAQADRVVRDLGGGRAHIVAVARVYDRYLPSQWQQRVQAGVALSYEDWLRVVFDPDSSDWERRNVWHAHDTQALVERWTQLVDPGRFTLIVADESDRQQLSRTFESLLGLPEGLLETKPGRSNQSMSLVQVEFLRAVESRLLGEDLAYDDYRALVRRATREITRAVPRSGPSRPRAPRWARELMARRSEERVEYLLGTAVNVIGDPESLRGTPVDEPLPGEWNGEPAQHDDAAVSELVGALLRQKV
jgi:hypothetical protein